MILKYLTSLYKRFKERRVDARTRRRVNNFALLTLRKYKIAILELHHLSGPKRKRLIAAKARAGTLWSKRQYNKVLAKALKDHIHLNYDECIEVINYKKLKEDFTYWSKKFFLAQV